MQKNKVKATTFLIRQYSYIITFKLVLVLHASVINLNILLKTSRMFI